MQDFQLLQLQFGQAVRQPEQLDFAGIAPERLAVYQQLLFNNVLNFVSSAFPVLCSLHDEADWQQLVRQFFRQSVATSPYFLDIAGQFFEWLQLQPSVAERMVAMSGSSVKTASKAPIFLKPLSLLPVKSFSIATSV